jgi:hypothetical protein
VRDQSHLRRRTAGLGPAAVQQLLILYVLVRLAWSVRQRERKERDVARTADEVGRQVSLLVLEARANARLVRRLASAVLLLALVNVSIVLWVAVR